MTSSPDNTVMKILEDICWVFDKSEGKLIVESDGLTPQQAKQSLDSHYLSIFLELVGADEPKTGLGDIPHFSYPGMIERNNLRQELRTALQDRVGEK